MRALFSIVSLLVVLAIVGLLASKQMKAVGRVDNAALTAAGVSGVPQSAVSGTPQDQARAVQNKVADDVVKVLNQGAGARREEIDKQ